MLNRIPLLLLAAALAAPAQSTGPRTMRVDYYHAGTATEEHLEEAHQKEEELRQKFFRERGGLTILLDDSLKK